MENKGDEDKRISSSQQQQQHQDRIDARGKQIHATGLIIPVDENNFRVPSGSDKDKYYDVSLSGAGKCNCAYYTEHHETCKHIVAARYEKETAGDDDDAAAVAASNDCMDNDTSDIVHDCRLNCDCKGTRCKGIPEGKKRCYCRCRCRNDPKAYDHVTTAGRIAILRLIMELMDMVQLVPYELGVGFGGRRGYDPKKIFAIIVLKTMVHESGRGMAGYLRDHPSLCRAIELPSIPSKNTILRAYAKTSSEYLQMIIKLTIAEIEIGDVATDSSGFSKKTYELWSTVKKSDGLRKGYLKLHILIDIGTRLIIDLKVTKSNVSDILVFREFLETFDWSKCKGGFMCADAAYLARDVCTIIAKLGYLPRIMPKKNTIARAKGSAAWREMVLFYQTAYKEFMKQYGRRSIVESVFGAIKQVYGNGLTLRLEASQETEMMLEALCHNATYVYRYRFSNDGAVYPDQPQLEQYKKLGLDSNQTIADMEPSTQDAISELIQKGILQPASGHDESDICDAIEAIKNRYKKPLFYPPDSDKYKAVQKVIAAATMAA